MTSIDAIPLPLPHVGSVNAWLLKGEPLTLIDTGSRSDEALAALERGLRQHGLRVEDVELVIGTHHHHDHVGLAATIKSRSGARIAVLDRTADYCRRYSKHVAAERRFARDLMREHGMPEALLAPVDALWEYIDDTSESFEADIRLAHGDRILAGGRQLDVISRPGHSSTDTLYVDELARLAFAGDHLLARISPNTEIQPTCDPANPRSRSRVAYLEGLKLTARMPVGRLLTGHGPMVIRIRDLVERQLAQHRRRCRLIMGILERGPADAHSIGRRIWSEQTVHEQPLLVLWEVLGHLDLLLNVGIATERRTDQGCWEYSLARRTQREQTQSKGLSVAHAG